MNGVHLKFIYLRRKRKVDSRISCKKMHLDICPPTCLSLIRSTSEVVLISGACVLRGNTLSTLEMKLQTNVPKWPPSRPTYMPIFDWFCRWTQTLTTREKMKLTGALTIARTNASRDTCFTWLRRWYPVTQSINESIQVPNFQYLCGCTSFFAPILYCKYYSLCASHREVSEGPEQHINK